MKIPVTLSAALMASGFLACKKPPPPPVEQASTTDAGPVDPMKAGAQQTFASRYSCPDDRITVSARPDIDPMRALGSDVELKPATPPVTLKDDAAGLAKWKAERDAERERLHALYARNTMFEVNGCGRMEILACQPHRNGETVYRDWADCLAARGGRETANRLEQGGTKP